MALLRRLGMPLGQIAAIVDFPPLDAAARVAAYRSAAEAATSPVLYSEATVKSPAASPTVPTRAAPGAVPPGTNAGALRIGGMALGNGVLMRSKRYWALARDDGTVLDGPVRSLLGRHWALRLPILRGVVALCEMIVFALRLHGRNGSRPNGRLLVALALCAVAAALLGAAFPGLDTGSLAAGVALELVTVLLGLLALRWGMGAEVWRYHGAEHKAVNAYEAGADLSDATTVLGFSRIHDRCGTNLVVIVVVLSLACLPLSSGPLGTALSPLYALAALAVAFELFRLVTRRPHLPACRAVLAGGKTLQRCLTTRDPRPEQQQIACRALRRVVELEEHAAGLHASGEVGVSRLQ